MAPLLRTGPADYRAHRLADAEPGALFLSRLGKRLSIDAAAGTVKLYGELMIQKARKPTSDESAESERRPGGRRTLDSVC